MRAGEVVPFRLPLRNISRNPTSDTASILLRQGFNHVCLGLYECIFKFPDCFKVKLYVPRALHCTDWLPLGHTVLEL